MISTIKKSSCKAITIFMVIVMLMSMLSTVLVLNAEEPTDDGVTSEENITATDDTQTDTEKEDEVVLPSLDYIPEFEPDTVKPVIVPVEIESNAVYSVDAKMASVKINEKRGLKSVKIYLNDREIPYVVEGELYSFVIQSSSDDQNIKVVAVDTSGNEASIKLENIVVSNSFFVLFINDVTYMITTIVIVVVAVLAIFGLVILIKKRIRYIKGL